MVLLRSLAQQTGVAVANARLHASREAANSALAETVAALERQTAIHDRFTQVALTGGGHEGIVRALHELTGLAAGIEDRGGALLAWAGPGERPASSAARDARGRERFLEQVLRAGRPVRRDGRLVTVASPRRDVVGVLFLVDPDGAAGEADTVALEHGATVLAIELARLVSLAETELRLGVDVVADLVGGTDVEGASRRAAALGRDVGRPHRVVVVGTPRSGPGTDALVDVVRAAVVGHRPPLLMPRGDTVVVLLEVRGPDDRGVLDGLLAGLRASPLGRSLHVGVGGVCRGPEDYPRSYREGRLALRVPDGGGRDGAVVVHDDLGVYQLLSEVSDLAAIDAFVQRWLGALLEYDARRGAALVSSLAHFLDAGAATTSRPRRWGSGAAPCVTASTGSATSPGTTSRCRTRASSCTWRPRRGRRGGRSRRADAGRLVAYLSTSPTTKNIEPRTATMSATRQPGSSSESTWTLPNEAERSLSRHGVFSPRETR
ncbi:hypothetical protein G7075_19710 [Phycicoccus sp. HDW14]|nr:hypothetical protein G7075_19710 [Phycicoccus sp. HDW14]